MAPITCLVMSYAVLWDNLYDTALRKGMNNTVFQWIFLRKMGLNRIIPHFFRIEYIFDIITCLLSNWHSEIAIIKKCQKSALQVGPAAGKEPLGSTMFSKLNIITRL